MSSKNMTKSELKKAANEQRLIDAAFDLFFEYGAEHATVEQITNKAGLAKGTFYLYFHDKQDILCRIIQIWADKLLGMAWERCYPPPDGCGGVKMMELMAEEIIDSLAKDGRLIGFIYNNLSFELFSGITASPAGGEPVNMLDKILELLERDGVKMKNPRIAIFLMVEMLTGACYQSINFENPLPLNELKPHLFTAMKGIVSCM